MATKESKDVEPQIQPPTKAEPKPKTGPRFKSTRLTRVRHWVGQTRPLTKKAAVETAAGARRRVKDAIARRRGIAKEEGESDKAKEDEKMEEKEEGIEETEDEFSEESFLAEDPEEDTTNVPLTIFNIVNYGFGPYVIVTPYALQFFGPFLGAPLLCATAFVTWLAMCLLIRTARIMESTNYLDMSRILGGRIAFYVCGGFKLLYYIGMMAVLNMLLKTSITKFSMAMFETEEDDGSLRAYVFIIIICCLFPLMLIRKKSHLTKLSVFSFCLMVYILGMIAYWAQEKPDLYRKITFEETWKSPQTIRGIAVYVFVYSKSRTCLLMYTALQHNTVARWNLVLAISTAIITVLTAWFQYSGFYIFYQYTQGDVLENFCSSDHILGVRVVLSVAIVFMYPGIVHKGRIVVRRLLQRRQSTFKFYISTIALMVVGALVSFPTYCVAAYVELLGVSTSTIFTLLLPGLFYAKAQFKQDAFLLNTAAMFLIYFSFMVLLYGFVVVCFVEESIASQCADGKDMYYCLEEEKTVYV